MLSGDEAVRAEAIRKETAYLRQIFEFAGLRSVWGLDVLEVGSGFGVGLIAIACLGARRARGIELVPWMVEWATRCAEALSPELGDRIDNEVGSVTNMPYESESVDVLLSLEAISHYYDYRPFLSEAWRVLRPGGTLIISDGNNGLNPLIRRRRVALWGEHERPPGAGRTRGPDYPFHFVDKRQAIIKQAFPDLPAESTLDLALATSGMVQDEVLLAARRYVEDGVLPEPALQTRTGVGSSHPRDGDGAPVQPLPARPRTRASRFPNKGARPLGRRDTTALAPSRQQGTRGGHAGLHRDSPRLPHRRPQALA